MSDQLIAFLVVCSPLAAWPLVVLWDALVGALVLNAPDSLEGPTR